ILILSLKYLGKEIVYSSYVKPVGYVSFESRSSMSEELLSEKIRKLSYRNKSNNLFKCTILLTSL
ncbi:MAG TPA: hypothetical protein VLH59_14555, partial [Ignavibacteriaceae bacterium]|nr:hypothetical protein [Ignavibacteriaceae bacterium]